MVYFHRLYFQVYFNKENLSFWYSCFMRSRLSLKTFSSDFINTKAQAKLGEVIFASESILHVKK